MEEAIDVGYSDWHKILDALRAAHKHHVLRDQSNGYLHLASETRYSPLTSALGAQLDRMEILTDERWGASGDSK